MPEEFNGTYFFPQDLGRNKIKVLRPAASVYYFHHRNIICPLNIINEMKRKKTEKFIDGIHAVYKVTANLPTMDIME